MFAQPEAHEAAAEGFNAGDVIIEHVSNSPIDHPLIHLPTVAGIDFSVTKHVFMLWLVATFVFVVVTVAIRSYLRQDRMIPRGFMNSLEALCMRRLFARGWDRTYGMDKAVGTER